MRDLVVEAKVDAARSRFIASLDECQILALASSYHRHDACHAFLPLKHGSFNVCFFVEFAARRSDGTPRRWVVRIPILDRIPWVDEKMDVEIATMRYVAAHTSIPVPAIHAYSSAKDSPIHVPFIIMDYVDGKNLKEFGFTKDIDRWWSCTKQPTRAREAMYRQLAPVYAQLRRLEFPEIGALGLPDRDGQPIAGLAPTSRFPARSTFKTAREYVDALLWLGDNLLHRGKNSMVDVFGEAALYATHHFRRFVTHSWFDPAQNRGPFVLAHGDLGIQNLLWDDDLNLVAVLDWEWSSVVPLQFLVPPPWLNGQSVDDLCHGQLLYNCEVAILCDRLRRCEEAAPTTSTGPAPRLSDEWARRKDFCHTLIVCALLRPEYVYDVYWSFISYITTGIRPRTHAQVDAYRDRIRRELDLFMDDDDRKRLLSRKQAEQRQYLDEEERYFGPRPAAET